MVHFITCSAYLIVASGFWRMVSRIVLIYFHICFHFSFIFLSFLFVFVSFSFHFHLFFIKCANLRNLICVWKNQIMNAVGMLLYVLLIECSTSLAQKKKSNIIFIFRKLQTMYCVWFCCSSNWGCIALRLIGISCVLAIFQKLNHKFKIVCSTEMALDNLLIEPEV